MDDASDTKPRTTTSDYVATHCTICAYGWTRRGPSADGTSTQSIWCLLNREPVWEQMTHCNRFEARDEEPLDSSLKSNARQTTE